MRLDLREIVTDVRTAVPYGRLHPRCAGRATIFPLSEGLRTHDSGARRRASRRPQAKRIQARDPV